jgi:hypothetical protein
MKMVKIHNKYIGSEAKLEILLGILHKQLVVCKRAYPKVSVLAAWSENCKWNSSLPLDAVVSVFCESV